MKLIKYRNPLTVGNGDWDGLFDLGQRTLPLAEALFGSMSPRTVVGERLAPVSVTESEENYEIKVELPGFVKEEVSATIDDDILSIVAERAEETEGNTCSGKVTRTLSLPGGVLANKVKASLANGVLAITLPKVSAPKPRTLKIT